MYSARELKLRIAIQPALAFIKQAILLSGSWEQSTCRRRQLQAISTKTSKLPKAFKLPFYASQAAKRHGTRQQISQVSLSSS